MVDITSPSTTVPFTLNDDDRILLPSLRGADVNGLTPSKGWNETKSAWMYAYPSMYITNAAALRFEGEVDGKFAYGLPIKQKVEETVTAPAAPTIYNGVSMSNSIGGYVEDVVRFLAPYITDGGAKSVRVPIKRQNNMVNGQLVETITLNGYATKQWEPLKKIIDFCIARDMLVVIDDHTYSAYSDPAVQEFWLLMGAKLKATYGDNDKIVLELQNESSKGGWDVNYATSVKNLVTALRSAGINYPLAIGWGGWNSVGNFTRAMTELDAIGGPQSIDPLNKIIWTAHHYPTPTGNDQPVAGKPAPTIRGTSPAAAFKTMFDGCKARGIKCMITEIGLGGGARAWFANENSTSTYTGREWLTDFGALVAQYAGTVVGVIGWGAGSAWADTYPLKMEYAKDSWPQTIATDFWGQMKKFWNLVSV
jgi:hypothetical protein